jgi:hypothetical protein
MAIAATQQKQEWNIRARSEICAGCQKPFDDEEEFYSMLLETPEGMIRSDYCAACWPAVARDQAVSIWQSVFRAPPPPPPEAMQKETAESLFRKIIADEDPSSVNTLYILAVMLERRRLLIERDVQIQEDGTKIRVYEYRRTNEVFLITDPDLKLVELQHVQEEVVARLTGGTEEPAPPSPEASLPPQET